MSYKMDHSSFCYRLGVSYQIKKNKIEALADVITGKSYVRKGK